MIVKVNSLDVTSPISVFDDEGSLNISGGPPLSSLTARYDFVIYTVASKIKSS